MKKARIIFNPSSGRENIKPKLIDIINVYEKNGYETSVFQTTADPESAKKESHRVGELGFDLVVSIGGDGTLNEVISGVSDLKIRPKIAVIPGGTTNDFVKSLGINQKDPVDIANVISKNKTKKFDIGKSKDNKYFINIAAMGNMSEVTYDISPEIKTMYGYFAYVAKGADKFRKNKSFSLEMVFDDGETFSDNVDLVFISLTNTVAGFNGFFPKEADTKGKFKILIIRKSNKIEFSKIFLKMLIDGSHFDSEKIFFKESSKIKINSKEELKINFDGELGTQTPNELINLKDYIEFIVN